MDLKKLLYNNFLILDGGMGTLLQKAGLKSGEKPELWNLTHPDIIKNIHKNYFNSGSNIVNTNTFGANTLNFSYNELKNIIFAAVQNAKNALKESNSKKEKFIALDIGPLGKLLKPLGELDFNSAVDIFATTVKFGVECGVDLITIETMSDTLETKAALLAAKENSNLPVFVTNAYNENETLLTGASPKAVIALLESMGADAIGVNCSMGPESLENVIIEYTKYASVPVIFKPNAGMPHSKNGVTEFDVPAESFVKSILKTANYGVTIFGGCCGTTPEYIELIHNNLKNLKPKKIEQKNCTVVSSYSKAVDFNQKPILIGERINPTGKKRFKQALIENDINYCLSEGIKQQEKGVDILDVNVGLPEIDEVKMLSDVVYELQAVTDLPLQIDTSNIKAMEQALRIYNGKALINSVNGKKESMQAIFPLVKKYGGVVICLTLDENGIPETAEGRVKIAEKIIETAKTYGISKNNLVFDTLVLAVSAKADSALVTLDSLKIIKEKLGCHTSLGISNISFGLPGRDALNGTFYALALNNGLSAAIINPFSQEILKTYYSFMALNNKDDNFTNYISYFNNVGAKPESNFNIKEDNITLKDAIIKGLKELAGQITANMLKTCDGLNLINSEIIPALDSVGQKYEQKQVFLPQLLMSAESAKAAFEQIKLRAVNNNTQGLKCKIILATVEGDIHDIGKNIVKLLLENYGFNVCDLGKDVPAETIVKKAKEINAPIVGLSALMTTTVPYMEKTIKLLNKELPNCKTVVGGAVLTESYAKSIGANKYSKDAMETVRYAEQINELLKNSKNKQ